MDIKITDNSLRYFLNTTMAPEALAKEISLCGPTFDKVTQINNDYLYEIEVITNRIDTASAQGIARDSNAILNQMGVKSSFINDPYLEKINLYPNLPKTFSFNISDKTLATRFVAITLENIKIKDSPYKTQEFLTLCGERPISNAVDITNELTLLYGMPSHVFDLDKLAPQNLIIRESKKGEEITTLDSQKNILKGGDIIIEDGAGRIVDLCGVMGGQIAEVDQHTKNILLVVPTYAPERVRKSSLYLQKRSYASQIYEKQPDPALCLPVLTKAIKLFEERAGAKVSSSVFDSNPTPYKEKNLDLDIKWANNLIGVSILPTTIISILKSLGFSVSQKNTDVLACTVPSWRYFDINIPEDLVEEIARVYGYSKLPPSLPCTKLLPEPKNIILKTESYVKNFLSCQGFNEIYNHSLVSENLIVNTDLQPASHLKLTNALSKDFEYLRTSLVPSILQNIKNNQGKSEEPYNLFEISNIYQKSNEALPKEVSSCVIASTQDILHSKGVFEALMIHLNLKPYKYQSSKTLPSYFTPESSAEILEDNNLIGYIGQIKPAILHKLGVTSNPTIAEIIIKNTASSIRDNFVYKPISEYPEIIEQMTIASKENIGEIIEKIYSSSNLINGVTYSSSYKENHTFKITFSSPTKNLTQIEVNDIKQKIQTLFN